MPVIAIVDGVHIIIYPDDHIPPHIHAILAEHECKISLVNYEVLRGSLPRKKMQRVLEWLRAHEDEVSFAWDAIYNGEGFKGRIK